jgi:hypothetical protein
MKTYLSLLFFFGTVLVNAQNNLNETLKQRMITDWERAKAYTQEYLEAMPASKYGFRPVDSVRTFAEQMLHLALSNTGMSLIGSGAKNANAHLFFNQGFGKSASAQAKDSVVFYVNTSYDIAITCIRNMDFKKLDEEVSRMMPGGKRTTTRLGWLLKAFEHQTHHRGQCTVYLRTAGIRPPKEKIWD